MKSEKDSLIDSLRESMKERDKILRKYEDDLRSKNNTLEWIINTLKSTLSVLESMFKKK